MLRAGYAGLGIAFAALAGSIYIGALLLPGLAVALLAGIFLAVSDDDIPKWAGIALLAYFVLSAIAFLVATPVTINKGDRYFVNKAPPELANDIVYWLGLASPVILAGAAIVASWERELAPRVLLYGAAGGFVLVGILTMVLVPDSAAAAEASREQGNMLRTLFAVSAAAGALGSLWSASRPEELA